MSQKSTEQNVKDVINASSRAISKDKDLNLEVNYQDKQPSNDKDIKSIVNYAKIVKLIKKLVKNKHYNFLETLAETDNSC